jgi:small-conductance mechanosensitive channel
MMYMQTWGGIFSESLLNLWYGFVNFVPGLLGAIILFVIGWVVGSIVGKAISQLLVAIKLDKLFENAGVKDFTDRAGIRFSVSGFFGGIVKWFIIIVFLMASLQIIGLTQVNDFIGQAVVYYLPKVMIAAFVLIIATVIADAVKKLIQAGAKAMNVHSANFLGSIAKYAIWIFALIIALSELGIATYFMQVLFMGFVVMFAIAGGLAFGLGGKEAAARTIEKISRDISKE